MGKTRLKFNLPYKSFNTNKIDIDSSLAESDFATYKRTSKTTRFIEESIFAVLNSKFKDYTIIKNNMNMKGTDQPCVFYAVALEGRFSEVLFYDPSSQLLNSLADEIIKTLDDQSYTIEQIIQKVAIFVKNALETNTEEILNNVAIDNIKLRGFSSELTIPVNNIESYLKQKAGCCRHHAIVTMHLLGKLIEKNILPDGKLYINIERLGFLRSTFDEQNTIGGHAWVLYQPNNPELGVWSIDTLRKKLISIQDTEQFDNVYGANIRNSLIRRHHLQIRQDDFSQTVVNLNETILELFLRETGLEKCGNFRIITDEESNITIQVSDKNLKLFLKVIFDSFLNLKIDESKNQVTIKADDNFFSFMNQHMNEISMQTSKFVESYLFIKTLEEILNTINGSIRNYSMDILFIDNILYLNVDIHDKSKLLEILWEHGIDIEIAKSKQSSELFFESNQLIILNPDAKSLLDNKETIISQLNSKAIEAPSPSPSK